MIPSTALLSLLLILPFSASVCIPRAPAPAPSPPSFLPLSSFGPHIASSIALSIKAICGRTDYPDACISAINPLLDTAAFGTTAGIGIHFVLDLLIKAGKRQTVIAQQVISKAAHDPATDKFVAMILDGCVTKYASVLGDYDAALEAVKASDKQSVQRSLSAVVTEYVTCSNGDASGDPTLDPSSTWAVNNKELLKIRRRLARGGSTGAGAPGRVDGARGRGVAGAWGCSRGEEAGVGDEEDEEEGEEEDEQWLDFSIH